MIGLDLSYELVGLSYIPGFTRTLNVSNVAEHYSRDDFEVAIPSRGSSRIHVATV